MLAPLLVRLWLWWHPRTRYGAKQARILIPLLATAKRKNAPVLFTAQGLGVFARVCRDPQTLGTVWLEGLLRAMVVTGVPPRLVHLPPWGAAARHVAATYSMLTGQQPWTQAPGDFARQHGPNALVTLPWDPIAQIGNEWWCGMWGTSGDPAAACNTDVAPTAQPRTMERPFAHVQHPPPFLGGPTTYQLMKWEGGTAVPMTHGDMLDDPEATLRRRLLHTLTARSTVKCHRFSAVVTLDAETALEPPCWTVKWTPESGVTVTSHVPGMAAMDWPRNATPGAILTLQPTAAAALWPKRPPMVMGVGNAHDGMMRLVLWHEESGPKLMLLPCEDWDEFALQFDMPLQSEVDDVLSECSFLQDDVRFHSPGHLLQHLGDVDGQGGTAHLAAVPGIALEHYDAQAATLLESDLATFRRE